MNKKFFAVMVLFITLAICYNAAMAAGANTPQQVHKKYISAVRTRQFDEVKKYIDSKRVKEWEQRSFELRKEEVEKLNRDIYDNYKVVKTNLKKTTCTLFLTAQEKDPISGKTKKVNGQVNMVNEIVDEKDPKKTEWKVKSVSWER
ncbi:MAG: hypothetical protein ACLFQV_11565 [Vulcanimicrobiota bacterium]